jgi:glyoxylase-like metal-dependent hydrolase (beta-lactamase superfamily II)
MNTKNPARSFIVGDRREFGASIERLRALPIETVCPGHGDAFPMERLHKSAS